MVESFLTRVPFRHDRLIMEGNAEPPSQSNSFRTSVPVRPSRLAFQPENVRPRTRDLVWKIRAFAGEGGPIYFPFIFRGSISGPPNDAGEIPVNLSEEPSGRPLEAEVPEEWFDGMPIFEGLPFRLFTWVRLDKTTGVASEGHHLESLLSTAKSEEQGE